MIWQIQALAFLLSLLGWTGPTGGAHPTFSGAPVNAAAFTSADFEGAR